MRAIVVAAMLIAAPSAAQETVGSWTLLSSTSKLDGATQFEAQNLSKEPVLSVLDQRARATLVLGCDSGKASVGVTWPDFINLGYDDHSSRVRYKLDSGPIETAYWFAGVDYVLQRDRAAALKLIARLRAAKTLVVSIDDKHGGQEVEFDLSGIEQATQRAADCH